MAEAPRAASRDRAAGAWRDSTRPVAERVADLVGRMTVEEKAGQLAGYWAEPGRPGEEVAPVPGDVGEAPPLETLLAAGIGHLTRVFGTAPVSPAEGAARLRDLQARVAAGNRFGIPAIAHEECLTGLMTWTAAVFPCPLAWGATFDPGLVEEMSAAVGRSMRLLGVHQGLAPVLDVVRDYRWGRTEESIGEDPHLVGVIGTAYVRGLERSGVVATVKHFAGYAASRAGRNMAPAALGPREFADLVVEPFVLALREGGARAVMHSYCDVDGMPSAADERLLSGLLRDELGFTGMVVADYFGIAFLETLHAVAGSRGEAAALALRAGIDVELPAVHCYGAPLVAKVRAGEIPLEHLDRSLRRVLTVKCQLGLLDGDAPAAPDGEAPVMADGHAGLDLDAPADRSLARRLAEESVVLLANDGLLPLRDSYEAPDDGPGGNPDGAAPRSPGLRLALAGPLADDPRAMLGCYTFPSHVVARYPGLSLGVTIPTLADALRAELPDADLTVTTGPDLEVCDADIGAAVAAAQDAPLCVLALGDRSGLFGRGTSGEGCDAATLALPGRQAELADAVLSTGTPTVIVLMTGRPYALGGLADRAAAVVQAFFPGEEGAAAIAGILSGRVEPSGRLPVGVPRHPGGQPGTYLQPRTGLKSRWSSADPTPLFPFGHGLTWTSFGYADLEVTPVVGTDGSAEVGLTVRNTGERPGTEVVQLYLSDPVASVVRPVRWLAGWARVPLGPGRAARVEFTVHADRTSFTGPELRRIVEPGTIEVEVGSSSQDLPLRGSFVLDGPVRAPGRDRVLTVPARVVPC